jgi:hypothetical protein
MRTRRDGFPPWGEAAADLLRVAVLGERGAASPGTCAQFLPELEAVGLDGLYYLTFEPEHPRQRLYDALWARQRLACAEVQAAAADEKITCLLFKGAAQTERWFGGHALGCMTDVDLLVRRTDIVRMIPLLYRLGYVPGALEEETLVLRDIQEIGLHEAEHYELVPYNRLERLDVDASVLAACQDVRRPALRLSPDRALARIELDVHHGIASDVDADGLFDRAVSVGGQLTFSDADHVWFGLSRLYAEVALHGKVSLRDLAYIGPIVARGAVSWDVVLRYAAEYELRPSIYYYLSFIDGLAGGAVPPEVLAELDPRRGLRHRDWGWQLGKLLGGIDPPPVLSTPMRAARTTVRAPE